MTQPPIPQSNSGQRSASVTWFIPFVFCGLALLLYVDPWPYISPITARAAVPARMLDIAPVRSPKLTPEIKIGHYTYRCSECHNLFPSPPETQRPLTQHQHIKLEHGINTRCFNCHNLTNRDAFADDFGQAIPFDEPQLLCAKCHGPVYRDWLSGAHGRTNGYWDTTRGEMTRRKCVECHDPHRPPFGTIAPAPKPNTLRLPVTAPTHEASAAKPDHGKARNPLTIYRQRNDGHQKHDDAQHNEQPQEMNE